MQKRSQIGSLQGSQRTPVQERKRRGLNNSGLWTDQENMKYYAFVYHHQPKFITKTLRKSLNVFKLMAVYIRTRTSSQCRTHHHNIISQKTTLENCLAEYFDRHPQFIEFYEVEKNKIECLEDKYFCDKKGEAKKIFLLKKQVKNQLELVNSQQNHQPSKEEGQKLMEILSSQESNQRLKIYNDKIKGEIIKKKWRECFYIFQEWSWKLSALMQEELDAHLY